MQRSRRFTSIGVLAVLCATGALLWHNLANSMPADSTMPRVSGAPIQQGWSVVRTFSGVTEPGEPTDPFLRFGYKLSHLFRKSTANDPSVPSIRLMTVNHDVTATAYSVAGVAGFTVDGRTPEGDIVPLRISLIRTGQGTDHHAFDCRLPAVPSACPYMDLIVRKGSDIEASWRVDNLPHLLHHALGPATQGEIEPIPDLRLRGMAQWNPVQADRPTYETSDEVFSSPFTVTIKRNSSIRAVLSTSPGSGEYWGFANFELQPEWSEPIPSAANTVYNNPRIASLTNDMKLNGVAPPFPGVPQLVQVKADLEEHDEVKESVTFHNVPLAKAGGHWTIAASAEGIVKKSPNGVTVTLMDESGTGPKRDVGVQAQDLSPSVSFRYKVFPLGKVKPIEDMALFNRHHVPVSVHAAMSVNSPSAVRMDNPSLFAQVVSGVIILNEAPNGFFDGDITFVISEDTLVQTVPFTLTIPIEKSPAVGKSDSHQLSNVPAIILH